MLIKRAKVENELNIILQHYNAKRNIKDKLIAQFESRGFLFGEINAIFTGTNPLMQLTDDMIYLFVWILYHNIQDESLKLKIIPEKILTEKEIEIAKGFKIERQSESIYPLTIKKVHEDADGDYSTIFTLEQLSKYFDERVLKYNHHTQRPLISNKYGVKEIFLNERNVRAIEKNILNGTQVPDEITLNILQNGEEEFEFNAETGDFTLLSGNLDCIDGWHRTVAGRRAYKQKPNLKFYYKVRIVNWDIDKAKAFIHQKSLGTQLDPLAKKAYDVSNPANQIVNKLNENTKSNISGMISSDKMELESDKVIIPFSLLFDVINHMFTIKDKKDTIQVFNFLRDGLNLITENDVDLTQTRQDDRLWTAYLVILRQFYNSEDWENKVIEIIDKISLNELQLIPYKTVNKTFIQKIQEYIESKVVS